MNLRSGPRSGPCSRGRPPFGDPAGAVRASARRALGPCRLSRRALLALFQDLELLLQKRVVHPLVAAALDGLFVVLDPRVLHPRRPATRGLILRGAAARTAAGRLDAALTP